MVMTEGVALADGKRWSPEEIARRWGEIGR
jgi:hypothetical protein